jgi:hypothetical protein
MTSIKMTEYFKKAIIFPGLLIALGNGIFGIVDIIWSEFRSEWLTQGGVIFISIVMVSLNAMFIGLLTTPIFLNYNKKIRSNVLICFLTWFLCPIIWISYLLIKHYNYVMHFSHKLDEESIFVLLNTIPFVVGLVWTFIRFRQDLTINGETNWRIKL